MLNAVEVLQVAPKESLERRINEDEWVDRAATYGVASRPATKHVPTCLAPFLNLLSSLMHAAECLVTLDAFVGCCIATTSTCLYWYYAPQLAVSMSWNIMSLAVVFPISQGITMAFKRREQALQEFANMLGNAQAVYGAVFSWKVKEDGKWMRLIDRFESPATARRQLHDLYDQYLIALVAYFDTERWGRSRQQRRGCGAAEQAELQRIAHEQCLCVHACQSRMQRLVQELKTLGLPGGEAHRLDQYVSKVGIAFERLSSLKETRTPLGFRAYARAYILLVSCIYGPAYVRLGLGVSGSEANVAFAIAFAIMVQLALSGLFETLQGLEDPFARRGDHGQYDDVKVPDLAEVTRRKLLLMEREAEHAWNVPTAREDW